MTPLFKSNKHQQAQSKDQASRVRVTARITANAYDAIIELQRRHRRKTNKALRLWEILDAAVLIYAKENGLSAKK